jgi:hypothetical protein
VIDIRPPFRLRGVQNHQVDHGDASRSSGILKHHSRSVAVAAGGSISKIEFGDCKSDRPPYDGGPRGTQSPYLLVQRIGCCNIAPSVPLRYRD